MTTQKIDAADKLRQLLKDSGAMTPQISSLLSRLKMDRDHAQLVCAEAYCVMGDLAHTLRLFEGPKMEKILDNLSAHRLIHKDVLPFSTSEVRKHDSAIIGVSKALYRLVEKGQTPTPKEMNEWAERLEGTSPDLMEDLYDQCASLIHPLVQTHMLPPSVAESMVVLVETFREHHGLPTDVDPEGTKQDEPDEDQNPA